MQYYGWTVLAVAAKYETITTDSRLALIKALLDSKANPEIGDRVTWVEVRVRLG